MTALGEQLAALGKFTTVAIADAAITAGQVVVDDNNQVRCAGSVTAIVADVRSAGQLASMTKLPGGFAVPKKGVGNAKW